MVVSILMEGVGTESLKNLLNRCIFPIYSNDKRMSMNAAASLPHERLSLTTISRPKLVIIKGRIYELANRAGPAPRTNPWQEIM